MDSGADGVAASPALYADVENSGPMTATATSGDSTVTFALTITPLPPTSIVATGGDALTVLPAAADVPDPDGDRR